MPFRRAEYRVWLVKCYQRRAKRRIICWQKWLYQIIMQNFKLRTRNFSDCRLPTCKDDFMTQQKKMSTQKRRIFVRIANFLEYFQCRKKEQAGNQSI